MLVGVYIDGFNLYYGARALRGKSTPGWRWLDLRGLSRRLIQTHSTCLRSFSQSGQSASRTVADHTSTMRYSWQASSVVRRRGPM